MALDAIPALCLLRWPMCIVFVQGDRTTQENDWDCFPMPVAFSKHVGQSKAASKSWCEKAFNHAMESVLGADNHPCFGGLFLQVLWSVCSMKPGTTRLH